MLNEDGFLKQIRLKNFLSYGEEGQILDLKNLNVLIGPNASGKSNFIEALRVLRAAPGKGQEDLASTLGSEFIWQGGTGEAIACIEALTESNPLYSSSFRIRYDLEFRFSSDNRFVLSSEKALREEKGVSKPHTPKYDYFYEIGSIPSLVQYVYAKDNKTLLPGEGPQDYAKPETIDTSKSILSQRYDVERFPNISHLADNFRNIVIFRDWDTGINSPVRQFQKTNQWDAFLWEDASNLALIINNLLENSGTRSLLDYHLERFSKFYEDVVPTIRGGDIRIHIREKGFGKPIPMSRLSGGYIRFLCLLAILCHPEPPPIVCIEEPEICMHPDILSTIAGLLVEASQRTQLFVTTHSDTLISALSDYPEAIIVCERNNQGTHLHRLEKDRLEKWLDDYLLGELWSMGEIGGNP